MAYLCGMAKTADLRIRLEDADLERIRQRAVSKHLPVATHVRQVLMNDVNSGDNALREPSPDQKP